MNKDNLTKKLGLVGLGAVLALGSGCSAIHPTTPLGQLNQYVASAKKVEDMKLKPKVVENNPFVYTVEDLTNAYASGCMDFSLNEKIAFAGFPKDSPQWAENFVTALNNYSRPRIDNQMACYASKQVINSAKQWQTNSYWTEAASAAFWSSIFSYNLGAKSRAESKPSASFGDGSSSGVGGPGLK